MMRDVDGLREFGICMINWVIVPVLRCLLSRAG